MTDKKLFSEFPPVTTAQWEEQINIDLKGADYDKKLVWRTNEGFPVRPYYRNENLSELEYLNVLPGEFPFVRGKNKDSNNWQVCQDFCIKKVDEANAKALDAIERGADAVGFSVCGKGLEQNIDVAALLKGICTGCNPVHLDVGVNAATVFEALLKDAESKKCGRKGVRGSIFYDPLGRLAISGCYGSNTKFIAESIAKLFELSKGLKDYRTIGVDAAYFQNCGATLVQELAIALAMGSEYMSLLVESGYSVNEAAKRMQFRFAIGSNYFMEIAKLRAARLLWANIVKAFDSKCSNDAAYMYIHGETADWNMTIYDPYVNLLRTTTEAMSGAIAGVDSLWVRPFDSAYRSPDAFSERIARNQQIILKEEAYISKIVDPSAGSYYIENLTASVAENAWKLFLDIEETGGYIAGMKGFIQKMVKESAEKRLAAVATRKETILGTNQYANTSEFMNDQIRGYRCAVSSTEEKIAEPLEPLRLGEAIEEMRLKTERSSRRPKAFMLTIGNLAMRKARASFACNFFSVAGFEVVDNNGFETVEEGVDAAVAAKADIIVLCSSDDEYPTLAPQAVTAAKGKGILVLAGYPKAIVEELKAAGIENFIFMGQNVLEALEKYQKMLEM